MIKSTILVLILVAGGGPFVTGAADQSARKTPTHVVDLIAEAGVPSGDHQVPEAERLRLPFGRHGRPTDEPPQEQPLSMQLLELDRTHYEVGDALIYQVLISNEGRRPVAFPTSTDATKFRRDMPRAVAALVGLLVDDPMLGLQTLGTQALYGAPDVPHSLVVLRPGETLELRATGVWHLESQLRQPVLGPWARGLKVRSTIHFSSFEDSPPALMSSNTVEVRLQKP